MNDTVGSVAVMMDRRRAGVLLHPTSLPSRHGAMGCLGEEAFHFVSFLANSGFTVWQMLPTGPTQADLSPYQSLSAHAGNPDLIDPLWLALRQLIDDASLARWQGQAERAELWAEATNCFLTGGDTTAREDYERFCRSQSFWLKDYACFRVLREHFGRQPWYEWPLEARRPTPAWRDRFEQEETDRLNVLYFEQFVFECQWRELRDFARSQGVYLFGDMPIFVSPDSADVWANQRLFRLDEEGRPSVVAGVPPDYFSEDGQRWGNPLYDWDAMASDGFRWWLQRVDSALAHFDLIRIDHFRGFEACWEIPAEAEHASAGHWIQVPGEALLGALARHYPHLHPSLPFVAENLGVITPEVEALREAFALPGMRILQFAFDGNPHNPYLQHAHTPDSVVYTGTHDNDTTVGWYNGLPEEVRRRLEDYLGYPAETMPWPLIRAAMMSVSRLAIVPMQDLLALDSAHRMNIPGTASGNWSWQFHWDQVPPDLSERLRHLIFQYDRKGEEPLRL
ncbi:4-alpha-glucanotransferase [Mangrovitalea sediminis]|uniref:4-alpha-glucanotransferase n=1 Tax=Mangrovitalea sediminis TaxID=1982043 RepID=UPI001D0CFFC2|nr:4-alpha-glucanotransferase [Mangrovitalea sediminis]